MRISRAAVSRQALSGRKRRRDRRPRLGVPGVGAVSGAGTTGVRPRAGQERRPPPWHGDMGVPARTSRSRRHSSWRPSGATTRPWWRPEPKAQATISLALSCRLATPTATVTRSPVRRRSASCCKCCSRGTRRRRRPWETAFAACWTIAHPGRRFVGDPGLIPNAIEEVLRFDGSVIAWRNAGRRSRSKSAKRDCRRMRSCSSCWRRPTAIPPSSPTRIASISAGRMRASTFRSASACTIALARHWRGWRRASRWRRSACRRCD